MSAAALHVPPERDRLSCWSIEWTPRDAALIDAATGLLCDSERQRAAAFRFATDRYLYIVAHVALRLLLAAQIDTPPRMIVFATGPAGRPELAGATADGVRFNLSHSGQVAMIAIAQGAPVGIDVEAIRDFAEMVAIAQTHFAPAEAAALARLPADRRAAAFTAIWTCKEAVVKALGDGLALPLDQFWTGEPEGPAHLAWLANSPDDWTIADLSAPIGYRACVAAPRAGLFVEQRLINAAEFCRLAIAA